MSAAATKSFVKRNIVAIVMVPSIVGIHFGWTAMQKNRTLVADHEELDAPPVLFAKFLWNKLGDIGTVSTENATIVEKVTSAVK